MSKLINNPKETILAATQRQLRTFGYDGTTLRSVAQECGISVGSVYNYFHDKDTLIQTSMMGDWLSVLASIKQQCNESADVAQGIRCIGELLAEFVKMHPWMSEYRSAKTPSGDFDLFRRRRMLHDILDGILSTLFEKHGKQADAHLCPLFTEMILTSVSSKTVTFDMVNEVVERLFG